MSFPISNLLDPSEFGYRWKRARTAALRAFVGPLIEEEEEEKLAEVGSENHDGLLRAVFENSKKLGQSAKWYFGAEWEATDFHEIISQSNSPCFRGEWGSIEEGVVLEREGCQVASRCGSYACDYFKEAMDGLVLGLSDQVSFTRHSSSGHGSAHCKDLFVEAKAKNLFFGPLPLGIESALDEVKAALSADGVSVEFPGQSEGVLYYRWRIDRGESCRDLSLSVERAITEALSKSGFDSKIKDITPRAIIGPGSKQVKALTVSQGGKKQWNRILS